LAQRLDRRGAARIGVSGALARDYEAAFVGAEMEVALSL
jgi:hypothetical protein